MTSCPDGVPYGTQLTARALTQPDAIAVTLVRTDGSECHLTWNTLERSANQWARALAARAVGVGDLVALSVPNSVELILGALAAWKVGAVPIPMRWDLPEWEQRRLLSVIDATLILDAGAAAALAHEAAGHDDSALPEVVSPALNGICSSGSTGLPKIILNTAPALWSPAKSTPFMTHWSPVSLPQTILVPAPMYHTNGFNPLTYLVGGDRLVVLDKFDAAMVFDAIERHRVTHFTATPTMLSRMADQPAVEKRDLSSVEWIMQGAAVMPPTLLRRWFDLLSPEQVVMAYGMTENLGLAALRGDEWLEHPGSVGRGFRDTQIRVLDPDGKPCPPGEIGEIFLRSAMADGYRYIGGAPPLPTTADGFTSAGDLGHLDADGFLYIADRRTDMIVTGGANVFPAEVETALMDHAAVVDVVVIGVADPHWGRRVHAVVQPADPLNPPAEGDVIAFAKTRLAGYKVPKTVEYVHQIPRTAATKVNRSAMVAARGG